MGMSAKLKIGAVGEDLSLPQEWELGERLAADIAAGLANLLSDRGDYTRQSFTVSEKNPMVSVMCKGFYVQVRWMGE